MGKRKIGAVDAGEVLQQGSEQSVDIMSREKSLNASVKLHCRTAYRGEALEAASSKFRTRGYCVLRDFLSTAQVEALREECGEVLDVAAKRARVDASSDAGASCVPQSMDSQEPWEVRHNGCIFQVVPPRGETESPTMLEVNAGRSSKESKGESDSGSASSAEVYCEQRRCSLGDTSIDSACSQVVEDLLFGDEMQLLVGALLGTCGPSASELCTGTWQTEANEQRAQAAEGVATKQCATVDQEAATTEQRPQTIAGVASEQGETIGDEAAAAELNPQTVGEDGGNRVPAPAYLFNEQYIVKPPHSCSSAFKWHWDGSWCADNDRVNSSNYLSVWCALDDADEENGTLYMLPYPSSQTAGPSPDPCGGDVSMSCAQTAEQSHAAEAKGYPPLSSLGDPASGEVGLPMYLNAGDAVVMSNRVVHCSGGNMTGSPRRAWMPQFSCKPITWRHSSSPVALAVPLQVEQA